MDVWYYLGIGAGLAVLVGVPWYLGRITGALAVLRDPPKEGFAIGAILKGVDKQTGEVVWQWPKPFEYKPPPDASGTMPGQSVLKRLPNVARRPAGRPPDPRKEKILARWHEAKGIMTKTDFCRREGIGVRTLTDWEKKAETSQR